MTEIINNSEMAGNAENMTDNRNGGNVQEVAAPETAGENGTETVRRSLKSEKTIVDEEPENSKTSVQSAQENAKYAGIRRKAELEAKQKADLELEDTLKKIGMLNPNTQKPIQNKEEYEEVKAQQEASAREEFMKHIRLNRDIYQNYIENLPEIQRAKQAEERAVNSEVKLQMEDEIRRIHAMNPAVKSRKDLEKMPTYNKLLSLVERGNGLVDAYKLANFETLTQTAAQAEKQTAINRIQSKRHMQKMAGRQGMASISVPGELMHQYRIFNPKATKSEIQYHYNKELRKEH
jgi:hypothetical protein